MKYFMGPDAWQPMVEDIEAAGHERVNSLEDAEVYINNAPNPRRIPEMPENIGWVQHCFTGVNQLIDAGVITPDGVPWCNSAGAFAQPVAESALGLALSQAHHHKAFAQAASWSVAQELDESQAWLYNQRGPKRVAIFGAGGIGKRLIRMLEGFGPRIIAVNRSGNPVEGADETFATADIERVWPAADYFVALAPLTDETHRLFNAAAFRAMPDHAVIINVGRGPLVDTDALVEALRAGDIAGAGLDVTDPEPLPDGHPLWDMPNVVITPHLANPPYSVRRRIGSHTAQVMKRYSAGEEIPTEVDIQAGY